MHVLLFYYCKYTFNIFIIYYLWQDKLDYVLKYILFCISIGINIINIHFNIFIFCD